MISSSHPSICIIGAGPYGVSIAAHLRALGIEFRIFGIPMNRWRTQMPAGMILKSEGCASSLYDQGGRHTLSRYCADEGLPFADFGKPVSRDIFARYAVSFQREMVPNVEESMVVSVTSKNAGFELVLNSGERVNANHVVIATGLEHVAFTPPVLAHLEPAFRSHSADHHDLSRFRGKDVTVIGAGQSALEIAALLSEEGAGVRLLARKHSLAWNPIPDSHVKSTYDRLRHPRTELGDGLQLWFYCNAPSLFRYLPRSIRIDRAKNVLGPAGGWWLKDRVVGRIPISTGTKLRSAEVRRGRVLLDVSDNENRRQVLTTEHVIAATGYRFELQRLAFLSEGIKARVSHQQQIPILSPDFESSVPGLYFTGLASSYSFGPVMRFLCGARYTSQRISSKIAASVRENRQFSRPGRGQVAKCRNHRAHG